jgi:DnaK suppressor protein
MEPNHLTPEQLEDLRTTLARDQRKLERSMRSTAKTMKPVGLDQTSVGRLSRIDSLQNQGLTRNLQEREQARLGQIVSARQRFEAGTYGRCVACSATIPYERLLVFPEAPTCAGCGA